MTYHVYTSNANGRSYFLEYYGDESHAIAVCDALNTYFNNTNTAGREDFRRAFILAATSTVRAGDKMRAKHGVFGSAWLDLIDVSHANHNRHAIGVLHGSELLCVLQGEHVTLQDVDDALDGTEYAVL